jgi:MFS family permease
MVGAVLVQAAALSIGPISLVQPVLVIELPITLVLAGRAFGAPLTAREWIPIAALTLGLAVTLSALLPSGGSAQASAGRWSAGLAVGLALAAGFVHLARQTHAEQRTACYGLATGTGFGLTAALISAVGSSIASTGPVALVTSWQTYLLAVLGPVFFLLLQKTLRSGELVASQPALTLSNPLVAVLFGVAVFGERVRGGWWSLLAVLGITAIVISTLRLARSPLLTERPGVRDARTRRQ